MVCLLWLFTRHSITAATAGMRILSREEWNKSFSPLLEKYASILDEYAAEGINHE